MRKGDYVPPQPAPPTPPVWASRGRMAVPTRPHDPNRGTPAPIQRVYAVPGGVFITVDFGRGRTATYRPRDLSPAQG